MHVLLTIVSYLGLIFGFLCAWLPDISTRYFSYLLVGVLLEFVIIQFQGFAGLYTGMAPEIAEYKRRQFIMLFGIFIFSLGLGFGYQQPVLILLCWVLYLTRMLSCRIEGSEGLKRVYALFRWVFDSLVYIVLALVLSLLPVPGLFLTDAVQKLGFVTAGPWVDYPELAAAQGAIYFLIQLIVFLRRKQFVEWLDRVSAARSS